MGDMYMGKEGMKRYIGGGITEASRFALGVMVRTGTAAGMNPYTP